MAAFNVKKVDADNLPNNNCYTSILSRLKFIPNYSRQYNPDKIMLFPYY